MIRTHTVTSPTSLRHDGGAVPCPPAHYQTRCGSLSHDVISVSKNAVAASCVMFLLCVAFDTPTDRQEVSTKMRPAIQTHLGNTKMAQETNKNTLRHSENKRTNTHTCIEKHANTHDDTHGDANGGIHIQTLSMTDVCRLYLLIIKTSQWTPGFSYHTL